jgi:hypothetical protein
MAEKTRAELKQDITDVIVTNNAGLITAVADAPLRDDMVDSSVLPEDSVTRLNDVPDFTGNGGKMFTVNNSEDSVEYVDIPATGSTTIDGLTDTPANKTGASKQFAKVDVTETIIEYIGTPEPLGVYGVKDNEFFEIPNGGNGADENVKISGTDTTAGNLQTKLEAGDNITLSITNLSADEKLKIDVNGVTTDQNVVVSSDDTTPSNLQNKIVEGSGVTITKLNAGANEQLEINSSGLSAVVDDPTPELGGDLTAGNNNITFQPSVAGTNKIEFKKSDGQPDRAFISYVDDTSLTIGATGVINIDNTEDINIDAGNTKNVILDGLKYPNTDGISGQVLTTDGGGNITFANPTMFVGYFDVGNITGVYNWDVSVNPNIIMTLIGNVTITLFNNINGGEYKLDVRQDGVGGRTIGFSSPILTQGGGGVSLTGTALSNDKLIVQDNGLDIKVDVELNYL